MSTDVPTKEPRAFIASETVTWSKSFADYPADEWTLRYNLRGPGTAVDFLGTADGEDFLITLTSAQSDLTAGTWRLVGYVEKGSDKHFVYDEDCIIRAKPAVSGTLETRSTNKIIVDAIDALMTGKASLDQKSYKIADRELERYDPEQLLKFRTYYWNEYVKEERAKRGAGTIRNINLSF